MSISPANWPAEIQKVTGSPVAKFVPPCTTVRGSKREIRAYDFGRILVDTRILGLCCELEISDSPSQ